LLYVQEEKRISEFQTQLVGTFRPLFNKLSFLSIIEPLMNIRPLILLFIVDASHSMRFYIDKKTKTVQRQTLVQTAIKIALNNPSIIRDGDYIGLATFSTEAKPFLPEKIVQITQESRESLGDFVNNELKSDGGQTNYGKAFELTLELFNDITRQLGADSSYLTGPILVWFLTDGRPWPADLGNTDRL
jgi:uncharacterized protein YegL